MTKVTICHEFDFYEDRSEINMVMHASEYHCTLSDLDNELRNQIKHGEQEWMTEEAHQFLERLRYRIWDSGVFKDE